MTDPRVELKACPFCGEPPRFLDGGAVCLTPECPMEEKHTAPERWNHRVPLPVCRTIVGCGQCEFCREGYGHGCVKDVDARVVHLKSENEVEQLLDAYRDAVIVRSARQNQKSQGALNEAWEDESLARDALLQAALASPSLREEPDEEDRCPGCGKLHKASVDCDGIPHDASIGGVRDHSGKLPSGDLITGTAKAITEALLLIWRAEPANDCTGQTWQDYADRCNKARYAAEKALAQAGVKDVNAPAVQGTDSASPAQPSAPSGVREAAQNVLKILRDNWMARMPEELQLALDALEAALASPEEKVHR